MRIQIAFLAIFAVNLMAQAPPGPNVAAQRDGMKKLTFLAGKWIGDATVINGPNRIIKVRQTEQVEFKLDGLVLLIEGTGRDPDSGKVIFSALATISYDDESRAYHFRSYNDGRYLDTEMKVNDKGFEWGYKAGPVDIKYLMSVNEKGEWYETGDVIAGGRPPQRTFEMTARKTQ